MLAAGETVQEDPTGTGVQQAAPAAGAGGRHPAEGLTGPLHPAGHQQPTRL